MSKRIRPTGDNLQQQNGTGNSSTDRAMINTSHTISVGERQGVIRYEKKERISRKEIQSPPPSAGIKRIGSAFGKIIHPLSKSITIEFETKQKALLPDGGNARKSHLLSCHPMATRFVLYLPVPRREQVEHNRKSVPFGWLISFFPWRAPMLLAACRNVPLLEKLCHSKWWMQGR